MLTQPPPLSTGDPGSFAMRTIVERKPRIIAQVIACHDLPVETRAALEALAEDIRRGVIVDPLDGTRQPEGAFEPQERRAWQEQISAQVGRGWLEIPWYFAEAYFYLRILLAWGYYAMRARGLARADDGRPSDPFHLQKEQELTGAGGGLSLAGQVAREAATIEADREALGFLLNTSLWGNRADLGCLELEEGRRRELLTHGRESLVVDHTDSVLDALQGARRVHMVLDNAGPELACDLLLAARLLAGGSGRTVTLHAKRTPFFVSDATEADVEQTLALFMSDPDPALSAAGRALGEAARAGRLVSREHWFWSSPLHFSRMPADLRERLAGADITIVKGDANYRRLLEDRRWDPWESMDRIAAGFPSPFASLRTMKSEIVVDVSRLDVARLQAEDPGWLTNGRRGIVRHCRAAGA